MRITGRTTRLVDQYIQDLFNSKTIEIKDHHQDGKSKIANDDLFHRLATRLQLEHRINIKYVTSDLQPLDDNLRTIAIFNHHKYTLKLKSVK